jgi:hypothetical protein
MGSHDVLAPLVAEAVRAIIGTLLPLVLCLTALKMGLTPMVKGTLREAGVSLRLRRLGFPTRSNLILRAADGTLTQIDHVVLTAQGVLAIETKNYQGLVFADARDRQWTQALGRQRNRFQSPLRQNFKHTEALRAVAGSPVIGLVVFVGAARFPRGLPDGVVTLREFDRHLLELGVPRAPEEFGPTWQRITEAADRSGSLQAAHRQGVQVRFGRDRRVAVAWACAIAAAVLFTYLHLGSSW